MLRVEKIDSCRYELQRVCGGTWFRSEIYGRDDLPGKVRAAIDVLAATNEDSIAGVGSKVADGSWELEESYLNQESDISPIELSALPCVMSADVW